MNSVRDLVKQSGGISALLFAVLLPVILLFFALVLDIANMFLVKRQLQVTADAAALAGASVFEFCLEEQEGDIVPEVRILPEAINEVDRAIMLSSEDFEFGNRGIELIWSDFSGVGTDSYKVELCAEAPTLLFGAAYEIFSGEVSGDKYAFQVHGVSEGKVDF